MSKLLFTRRNFIRTSALAAAGTIAAPYILPSGRLFARTGQRVANHVVFVLFGGGLRNQETVSQGYLSYQGSTSGNVMPNMLAGAAPSTNLIYQPWLPTVSKPLTSMGTLYKEVRYA